MPDFTIKEGDTSPAFEQQLQDDSGGAVDISGFNEVRFLPMTCLMMPALPKLESRLPFALSLAIAQLF